MKRIFILATLTALLFATGDSYAQNSKKTPKSKGRENDKHRRHETYEPRFCMAIKGGLNMQMMEDNTKQYDNWIKPGFMGGIFFNVERSMFGFQGEGILKTCRYYVKGASYIHMRTVNFDVPLLLSFRPLGFVPILDRVKIVAGPQFSFLVSAVRANRVEIKNDFTNADVAAALGLEVDLPLNLHVGIRGLKGLVNINNTKPAAEWYNSSIQATLGFRFLN